MSLDAPMIGEPLEQLVKEIEHDFKEQNFANEIETINLENYDMYKFHNIFTSLSFRTVTLHFQMCTSNSKVETDSKYFIH